MQKLSKDQKRKKKLKLRAKNKQEKVSRFWSWIKVLKEAPEHVALPQAYQIIFQFKKICLMMIKEKEQTKEKAIPMSISEETKATINKVSAMT